MTYMQENFNYQKKISFFITLLFLIKFFSWVFTHSVAILTDAVEYTINVVAGFVSLYSLYLSAKPSDENHPYGHGKAEFVSAAFEGILMMLSCFLIIFEAIDNIYHPHTFHRLDFGIYLLAFTAVCNFVIGYYVVRKGKKNGTLTLIATGKHMQSDTYGTVGIVLGLIALYYTGFAWLDSGISLIFSVVIFISGYKILRGSMAGIMDEADGDLLKSLVDYLGKNRRENWIDIHNLRIIKYGSLLHCDCHLTVPWYMNVIESHDEIKNLETLVRDKFQDNVELFIHTDACVPESCPICTKSDCKVRTSPFVRRVEWDVKNVSLNKKHTG